MIIISAAQYARAKDLMARWLDGRIEVRLGEAARALSTADEGSPGERLGSLINGRMTAGLLKTFKYRKIGMSGSGYDREPVYRRISGDEL